MRRINEVGGQTNVAIFVEHQFNGHFELAITNFFGYLSKELGEQTTEDLIKDWRERALNGESFVWQL